MKAILLAAGRSFRMDPIADKNFLKFCGQPLVEWQLKMLKGAGVREVFIVGGKHNLKRLKGVVIRGIKIHAVEQKNLDDGMAGAVLSVKHFFKAEDPMLIVSSNDMVDGDILQKILKEASRPEAGRSLEGVIVGKKVDSYFPGGYLVANRQGFIKKIVEKPGEGREPSDMVNLVIHLHFRPQTLFDYLEKIKVKKDDRYEAALTAWLSHGARFRIMRYDGYWQPVKYPWDILQLMSYFLRFAKSGKPKRGKNVLIKGQVVFGKNVKIFDNTVIHGPCYIGDNSIIGNNVLIRNAHIGASSLIGFGSEVARSYLGERTRLHANYIGDSVLGDNVAFGAGTVTGNFRLDEQNIAMSVKGEKIDCGFNKCGMVTGDNVRVGINTSFMPGVKIGSSAFVGAGIVVAEDIPANMFVTGAWKLKMKPNRAKPPKLSPKL